MLPDRKLERKRRSSEALHPEDPRVQADDEELRPRAWNKKKNQMKTDPNWTEVFFCSAISTMALRRKDEWYG